MSVSRCYRGDRYSGTPLNLLFYQIQNSRKTQISYLQAMTMLITSMIVKVAPSKAMEVSRLLGHIPQVAIYGVHKGVNIIVVFEAINAAEIKNISQHIASKIAGVLSIFQVEEISDGEMNLHKTGLLESPKPAAPMPPKKAEKPRPQSWQNFAYAYAH
jgi:nitrate reductase NapAB chaperone NapD